MKKLIGLSIIITTIYASAFGQCKSLYSFAAYSNTVSFCNLSTVSNAHYFWNFGDGTGSNFLNPIHTFPETGDYIVTLFAKDTISNCSSYYEHWVNVTKYSSKACQPGITDTIYDTLGTEYLKILDKSLNCNNYKGIEDGGPAQSFPINHSIDLVGWQTSTFRMVCRETYIDSIGHLMRQAYKSAYLNYSSSYNYGDSSANFEFTLVSKSKLGETIFFKAMNKTAVFYQWDIAGFGNPIYSNYDTISQFFPKGNDFWIIGLTTRGSNGYTDAIYQNVVTDDSASTRAITRESINVCCDSSILEGQSVQLSSSGGSTYLWMPSSGLSCDSCSNPTASPSQNITYTVITNDSGCIYTKTVSIEVGCGEVYVPNAFSPNKDGQNDILYVRGICIKQMNFIVFDRWGNKVFETENQNIGWDGTFKGEPMNTGTYSYYLTVQTFNGNNITKKGNVSLVR